MNILKRIKLKMLNSKLGKFVDDKQYLKIKYYLYTDKRLNLDSPKGFSEKLQWLKLHDTNSLYPKLVDKIGLKGYATETIGPKIVATVLGEWLSTEEIDYHLLPERFVLKCNHDSGSTVIIDKNNFNRSNIDKKFRKRLKNNYFYVGREWPYKEILPVIFAEEILTIGDCVMDIKLLCFHGNPKVVICYGKKDSRAMTFYDLKWNKLPCHQARNPNTPDFEKPKQLDIMIDTAIKLTKGIPFVRVDFMIENDQVWLSEMTFFPSSGFSPIIPEEYEVLFGSWIKLPVEE